MAPRVNIIDKTHESADRAAETSVPPKGKQKPQRSGGKNVRTPFQSKSGNTLKKPSESVSSKSTPGFPEGLSALTSYGLSLSGRKERVLSAIKTDKYFHLVEQSWQALCMAKPSINERFSYAEFKHASALQLYHRIEAVKFDALGVKPSAPQRIPLPRDTRVFQPIWTVLANIGIVDDEELRTTYIPDAVLPSSKNMDSNTDMANLLACVLYDWSSSWDDVLKARSERAKLRVRDGLLYTVKTNEKPFNQSEHFAALRSLREKKALANERLRTGRYKAVGEYLLRYPPKAKTSKSWSDLTVDELDDDASDQHLLRTEMPSPEAIEAQITTLFSDARSVKQKMTSVKFETSLSIEHYVLDDQTITTSAGSYGEWLRWDPQLWLEYEQLVETLAPVCLFSLSMPNETTGTYMWLLPVEAREKTDSSVSARLPKASIPPSTWILSLLTQMSTLPLIQRANWYVETDRLSNVIGLRRRFIMAAIKDPTAVEQFGTY